jgi:hypothetical protein
MPKNHLSLTREEQVREIVRCGKDPTYFTKNYVKIQHPTRGTVPFETYPFQDDCISDFQKNRFNIVLKSRQLGLSTICADYATWDAIFHRDRNILVIATKLDTAINFIKKVKVMLQSLPKWLLLPKFEDNKRSIRFSNGSVITAIPTSPDAGRSEALSLLIVDEAAFIRDFEDIWTGLYPTISTGGNAIILSTPNGVGGQYYKLWTQAEAGLNEFNPIRLPWQVHPEHDQEWFDKETRNLPKRKVSQEFLCDFITSGDTYLQSEVMDKVRENIVPPTEKSSIDRNIWIWKKPELDHRYVISADVARGDSNDFSAFHVIDANASEVVAEYKGKTTPDRLADLLADFGKQYNNALLCPENNTFGYTTCIRLKDMGYPRLYYSSFKGDPFEHKLVDPDEIPGFSTQQKSRIQILTHLEEVIRNSTIKIHSQRLYDELQSFVWHGVRAQASKDGNDDLIMSLAIGAWLALGTTGSTTGAMEIANALLKATGIIRTDTSQMSAGINQVGPLKNHWSSMNQHANSRNYLKPKDADSVGGKDPSIHDFSWLLR